MNILKFEDEESHLEAGRVPMSWSKGLNGSPWKKVISSSSRSFKSEANGA